MAKNKYIQKNKFALFEKIDLKQRLSTRRFHHQFRPPTLLRLYRHRFRFRLPSSFDRRYRISFFCLNPMKTVYLSKKAKKTSGYTFFRFLPSAQKSFPADYSITGGWFQRVSNRFAPTHWKQLRRRRVNPLIEIIRPSVVMDFQQSTFDLQKNGSLF